MTDHKDHIRRLGAKNDVSTLSSAMNSCTYTTPNLWEMVHGFGRRRELRRTLGMLVVKAGQGFHIRRVRRDVAAKATNMKTLKR